VCRNYETKSIREGERGGGRKLRRGGKIPSGIFKGLQKKDERELSTRKRVAKMKLRVLKNAESDTGWNQRGGRNEKNTGGGRGKREKSRESGPILGTSGQLTADPCAEKFSR